MKVDRTGTTLRRLHWIFIAPGSDSKPIRICRESLTNHLQDKTRCTDIRFYVSPSVLHLELRTRCLRLMNTFLKNIYKIPHYDMNADTGDLDLMRVKRNILVMGWNMDVDHRPSTFGLLRGIETMPETLSSH
jgi:hypothetical protein